MRKALFPQPLRLPVMAVLVAATVLVAGPAAAGQGFGPHVGGPYTGNNWAGYVTQGTNGEFKKLVGEWTEPAAKCTSSSQLASSWIGLDGYGDQTVEQTGVAVECGSGTSPSYQGWYEMYPAAPVYFSEPISAGDLIHVMIVNTSGHTYTLALNDTTKGWRKTETQSLSSATDASAEAVIEDPTGHYPYFYNGISFGGVSVDGRLWVKYPLIKLISNGYTPGPVSRQGQFNIRHR